MMGDLCKISPHPGENIRFDGIAQSVQLFLGSVPAQRDPERAVNDGGRQLHGIQNMAAVALGAGRTGGSADPGVLQNVDRVLGGDAGNGDRKNIGCFVGTVDHHAG